MDVSKQTFKFSSPPLFMQVGNPSCRLRVGAAYWPIGILESDQNPQMIAFISGLLLFRCCLQRGLVVLS